MRATKEANYRRAKALISNGMDITAACRSAAISVSNFNFRRQKEASASEATIASSEPTLEEQVIASDLSAKAKVKILSTLLGR